jgi:hypothetical protein
MSWKVPCHQGFSITFKGNNIIRLSRGLDGGACAKSYHQIRVELLLVFQTFFELSDGAEGVLAHGSEQLH